MSPRPGLHTLILAAALSTFIGASAVDAQVLEVSAAVALGPGAGNVAGPTQTATAFTVSLSQVRVGRTTVGIGLGHRRGVARVVGNSVPPAGALGAGAVQLDLALSANETFGPLGNVIFEVSGSVRTDALAQAALTVRGTIGPLAARLRLTAFGADAAVFAPVALAGDERPSLGGSGVGATLGVTARLGRTLILDAEPGLYLTRTGPTARLDARLRALKALGDNELRVYVHAATLPASTGAPRDWHAAFGAGVLWPRGRAPDLEVAALVGTGNGRWSPGLRVSLAETLPGNVKLTLDGGLEPYRVDVHPLRIAAGVELPISTGATLALTAVTAALDDVRPSAIALQSAIRIPVTLP